MIGVSYSPQNIINKAGGAPLQLGSSLRTAISHRIHHITTLLMPCPYFPHFKDQVRPHETFKRN